MSDIAFAVELHSGQTAAVYDRQRSGVVGRAQIRVNRVAEHEVDRLVLLSNGIADDGHRKGLAHLAWCERQCAAGGDIVLTRLCCTVRCGVIYCHRHVRRCAESGDDRSYACLFISVIVVAVELYSY